MDELIPPPDPHSLLPQFLACLPTAFVSPRPPPALDSLLSPILRQRVQLLSSTTISISDETWLNLLCWDNEKASRIQGIVESTTFEPHPVSGELEIGDVENMTFKRFDLETLRAQLPLPEWDLTVLYLWCGDEPENRDWKVAELLPYDLDLEHDPSWNSSIVEATEAFKSRASTGELHLRSSHVNRQAKTTSADDDSDYWAQYDRTPGRTPSQGSPGPGVSERLDGPSEQDYYARYGSVQPAMDPEDPTEHNDAMESSTLNGDVLTSLNRRYERVHNTDLRRPLTRDAEPQLHNPQPSPPPSQGSDTVAKLEETAEKETFLEIGIRQHISTSVKSMYRLARSCGIDRDEFQRMIGREMEVLAMLEE